ncbi:MAG: hypothetical protein LBV13_06095 [Methanomassiliicoccaceae archaeon]|nr:hypothetical protein [Methanomassiliicoccaceae archaeon]
MFLSRWFSRKKRERSKHKTVELGCNLSAELKEKVDSYFNDPSSRPRPSDYLTWDEFYEVFTTADYGFEFNYEDYMILLYFINHFIVEGEVGFSVIDEEYDTPAELLENARLCGKSIKDMWNGFTRVDGTSP